MLKPTRSKRDRAKDPRRTANSVRTHEETMAKLGAAANWSSYEKDGVRWAAHPNTSFGFRHQIVGIGHVASDKSVDPDNKTTVYRRGGWDGAKGIADQIKIGKR